METLLKDILFETVENRWTFKEDLKNADSLEEKLKVVADFVNQNYTPKK